MRIAITGHTAGIGKSIANWYEQRDHEIIGFSRSNGFDLSISENLDKIVELGSDCDMFINNAYHRHIQTDLLYAFHEKWKHNATKTIFVIGSISGDITHRRSAPYATYKTALNKAAEQLQLTAETRCRILNIKPAYVDTQMISHLELVSKLKPDYIASLVAWMVDQTEGHILNLTVAS